MKALIVQLVNSAGQFLIGIILLNANGTIATNGAGQVFPASNSPADIRQALNTTAVTYAATQGYTIADEDVISIAQPVVLRTYTNPTRSLNSAFQVSATQDAQVSYTVDIAATLSLTTGQTGTVVLEYADDSGFTTNVVGVQSSVNANTGTLALGLGLTQTATASVSGMVPAGKYVRIRTVNTTGTPIFTYRSSQEVLI